MPVNTLATIGGNSSMGIAVTDDSRIDKSGIVAAWSLRRLFDDYSGPIVRVRGNGDNSQRDFSAAADGNLDMEAMANWVGTGNNGHVVNWYDQSGNGHHAAAANGQYQPMIVLDGEEITENDKPALWFTGELSGRPRSMMEVVPAAAAQFNGKNVPIGFFSVARLEDLTTSRWNNVKLAVTLIMQAQDANNMFIAPYHEHTGTGNSVRVWRKAGSTPLPKMVDVDADYPTVPALMSYVFTGAFGRIWKNGKAINTWADQAFDTAAAYNRITIGGRRDPSNIPLFNGTIQEIILYNRDKRLHRRSIEANIQSHYGITQ